MMSMSSNSKEMYHGKYPMLCASGIFGCCLLTLDTQVLYCVVLHCIVSTVSVTGKCCIISRVGTVSDHVF